MLNEKAVNEYLGESGEPSFRLRQLKQWVYRQGVTDFAEMSDIPASLRSELARRIQLISLEQDRELDSADGQTTKVALRTRDGLLVEIVLLRNKSGRISLCISSQVGCAVGCAFCATGQMGLVRDLSAEEIFDQVLFVRSRLRSLVAAGEPNILPNNVIIMGMGEPFLNYKNTLQALEFLQKELGIGGRRLTVSTVGIIPGIERFTAAGLQVNLALSLHSADQQIRDTLIPISRKYPLSELRRSLVDYIDRTGRKVFIEYVLLDGINDSSIQARKLIKWLPERLSHVNLIGYNMVPGLPFKSSDPSTIKRFQEELQAAGVPVTIRYPMGDDIAAGCGQLAGKA